MCEKQLADTCCCLMILPLLFYVTEQVTARTGTRIRYDHCLLTCAKLDSFFGWCLLSFHHLQILSNSLSLHPSQPKILAHSNFLQLIQVQLQKLIARTPLPSTLLHHLRLQLSPVLHVLAIDILRTAITVNHVDRSYGVRYAVYLYNSWVLFSIKLGVKVFLQVSV